MPDYKYNNQATSQAITSISAGATSVILETGKGALFPSTYPFQVLLQQYNSSGVVTAQEIASCTNRSSDTLTITRANEAVPNTPSSTTQAQVARTFDVGIGIIQVTNVTTAAVFTEVVNSVKTTGNQNIAGEKTFTNNTIFLGNSILGNITAITGLYISIWKPNSTTNQIDSYTNGVGYRDLIINGNQLFLKSNGNVGIGTSNPTEKLEVNGNIKSQQLTLRDDALERHTGDDDNAGVSFNYFGYNGGTSRFRNASFFNGKGNLIFQTVGSNGKIRYRGDGSYGNGKVLTSDSDGNATWQAVGNFQGCLCTANTVTIPLTASKIAFSSEIYDDNNFHDNVTNNSRLTVNSPGRYRINVNIIGNGQIIASIKKNNTSYIAKGRTYGGLLEGINISVDEVCVGTDYFEIEANTISSTQTADVRFSITKI